jgi:hypothetical protein
MTKVAANLAAEKSVGGSASENRSQQKLNGFLYILQISALEAFSIYVTH